MAVLTLESGMRPHEVHTLCWQYINLGDRLLHAGGKTENAKRSLTLTPASHDLLRRHDE